MLSDPNSEFLPLVDSDEFLPSVSNWTTLGGLFLIGTVGISIALASAIKYNVTVQAPALIRPTGEIRVVQAVTEGTVKNILVKENQVVKQGDVIAYIDASQLEIKKSQIAGNINQEREQSEQIDAQIKALDGQTLAEMERNQRSVASATAELSQKQQDVRERQGISNAEVEEAKASIRLADNELQKAQADFKAAETNLKSTQASLNMATSRWNRYQSQPEMRKALSRNLLEEAELAVEQQKQTLLQQKANIEGQRQAVEMQQKAIEVAKARYQKALAGINPGSATVVMAKEKIATEEASTKAIIARLQQERESLLQKRTESQNRIKNLQKETQQLAKELTKTLVVSPETGTILKLELRNSGQFVRPGDAIAQIAPSSTNLTIKARVASSDISKVKVCKTAKVAECKEGKVQMRVSSYSYTDYGLLNGAVRAVSGDAIGQAPSAQNNSNVSAPYYQVTIEPEKLFLVKGNKQYPIQAGMEVEADIISKEETALTFILRKARLLVDL